MYHNFAITGINYILKYVQIIKKNITWVYIYYLFYYIYV